MSEQWVLLWSHSQNAVKVDKLEAALSANRQAYRDNLAPDFIPLFAGTRGHVDGAALHCSGTLVEREFGLQGLRPAPATVEGQTA